MSLILNNWAQVLRKVRHNQITGQSIKSWTATKYSLNSTFDGSTVTQDEKGKMLNTLQVTLHV